MRLLTGLVNAIEAMLGWLIGKRNGGEYYFAVECQDCNGTGRHLAENETYHYTCASCNGEGVVL